MSTSAPPFFLPAFQALPSLVSFPYALPWAVPSKRHACLVSSGSSGRPSRRPREWQLMCVSAFCHDDHWSRQWTSSYICSAFFVTSMSCAKRFAGHQPSQSGMTHEFFTASSLFASLTSGQCMVPSKRVRPYCVGQSNTELKTVPLFRLSRILVKRNPGPFKWALLFVYARNQCFPAKWANPVYWKITWLLPFFLNFLLLLAYSFLEGLAKLKSKLFVYMNVILLRLVKPDLKKLPCSGASSCYAFNKSLNQNMGEQFVIK